MRRALSIARRLAGTGELDQNAVDDAGGESFAASQAKRETFNLNFATSDLAPVLLAARVIRSQPSEMFVSAATGADAKVSQLIKQRSGFEGKERLEPRDAMRAYLAFPRPCRGVQVIEQTLRSWHALWAICRSFVLASAQKQTTHRLSVSMVSCSDTWRRSVSPKRLAGAAAHHVSNRGVPFR